MIVSCPSCGTRYRHRADESDLARQARCSQCETTFPFASAKRAYVLLPSRPAAGRVPAGLGMKIGLDEPGLAEQVQAAGLDGVEGTQPAMTYAAVAEKSEVPAKRRAAWVATSTGISGSVRAARSSSPRSW